MQTEIKDKKFSIIQYQEELIEKLNKEHDKDNASFLFFEDKNKKVWKINSYYIEFIEDLKFNTLLPPFKEGLLAVANIQEKEILLVDLDSYIYKETSIFRNNESKKDDLMKKYKCILLKNKKIGFLVKILPSHENNDDIAELNVNEILDYIND
jgi:hypothetical protein